MRKDNVKKCTKHSFVERGNIYTCKRCLKVFTRARIPANIPATKEKTS